MNGRVIQFPNTKLAQNEYFSKGKTSANNQVELLSASVKDSIIDFDKKAEDLKDKWITNYLDNVFYYYAQGNLTLSISERNNLISALTFFAEILYSIHRDQTENVRLYNSYIGHLNLTLRFKRTLLGFIISPQDNLNVANMRDYLKELHNFGKICGSPIEYLYEYFDLIIEATTEILQEGRIEINYKFINDII